MKKQKGNKDPESMAGVSPGSERLAERRAEALMRAENHVLPPPSEVTMDGSRASSWRFSIVHSSKYR